MSLVRGAPTRAYRPMPGASCAKLDPPAALRWLRERLARLSGRNPSSGASRGDVELGDVAMDVAIAAPVPNCASKYEGGTACVLIGLGRYAASGARIVMGGGTGDAGPHGEEWEEEAWCARSGLPARAPPGNHEARGSVVRVTVLSLRRSSERRVEKRPQDQARAAPRTTTARHAREMPAMAAALSLWGEVSLGGETGPSGRRVEVGDSASEGKGSPGESW